MDVELSLTMPPDFAADDPPVIDDAWIAEHYEAIFRAAFLMLGCRHDARDVAQEVFITAIGRANSFSHRSSHRTWLHGILIKHVSSRRRFAARWTRRIERYAGLVIGSGDTAEASMVDPAVAAEIASWRTSVWAVVADLPRTQSEVVSLRFAAELPIDEIAKVLDVPVGTVKSRIHHGLRRLKTMSAMQNIAATELSHLVDRQL